MKRHPELCSKILALLFSEGLAAKIGSSSIQTQRTLTGFGKPDILIEAGDTCLVVEVKTDPLRPLGPNQNCGPHSESEEEFRGYIKYLRQQREKSKRGLAYLVPEDWRDKAALEAEISKAHAKSPEIFVQLKTWHDVVREIHKLAENHPLTDEFLLLLLQKFDPLRFVDEDIEMLFSNDFPIRAVWNIERLLEAISKKAKSENSEKCAVVGPNRHLDKYEIDCYFKKDGKDVLYLGCWVEFWEEEGFPLCFGIYDEWDDERPGLKGAFRKSVGKNFREFGGYTLSWVTEEVLNSDDPCGNAWKRLKPIVDCLCSVPTA
jgi:hypothetical protein